METAWVWDCPKCGSRMECDDPAYLETITCEECGEIFEVEY